MSPSERWRRWVWALATIGPLALGTSAKASPWTLPEGRLALGAALGFQQAGREFLENGASQAFPLRGRFLGAELSFAARLGVTDDLEIAASLPLRLIQQTADPVILSSRPQGLSGAQSELDFYQNNVIDFSQRALGLGDLRLDARYRLLRAPFALAVELGFKLPTGYQAPEGTFGVNPTSVEDFNQRAAVLTTPANIRDDVTLGDAQVDIRAQIHAGMAFRTGTFVRMAWGYNLRLEGAADQLLGSIRLGQSLGGAVLIYAGADLGYSVQSGRIVGISVTAIDPELPAQEYGGAQNIRPIPRRLRTDRAEVTGGLIFRASKLLEVNVAYSRVFWGRFVAASDALSLNLTFVTKVFSAN